MKKYIKHFLGLGLLVVLSACENPAQKVQTTKTKKIDLVNPLMGTDSSFEFSQGNTYPAVAVPWGMNFWTPQTGEMKSGWTYTYHSHKIRGIKQTHQPSPWINDYGAFSLFATTDTLIVDENKRESYFSHKAETSKPHYYKVYLASYDTEVEMVATNSGAKFRFTFPKTNQAYILLDAFFKGSMVEIFPEQRKVIGYAKNNNGGVPDNFKNYFVAVFNKDFKATHTFSDGFKLHQHTTKQEANHTGAILEFSTERKEVIEVSVASSFIDHQQAETNLKREVLPYSFEELVTMSEQLWEEELSKIEVVDDNIDQVRTFYSCLYRVLLFPRRFYEQDNNGNIIHYSPYNGQIEKGYLYTDNGFWDTFRSVFPLFNLVYQNETKKMLEGLVNTYRESGWLPEWASPGHRNCMIGSNSASIAADAYLKGLVSKENAEILLEAMIKSATVNEGRPEQSVGRFGVEYYNSLGYVPYDVNVPENTARTLEYAYADYCIALLSKALGHQNLYEEYLKKSQNYRNVFDKETSLMRGRNKDGQFQTPFNPLKWGDAFTEGNSLHYTWSVFQDFEGLISLMGGKDAFEKKLDEVFETPPHFDDSYYGFPIHEIREMQVMNMGNYAHGNQPAQHIIYLYNHTNPEKAQKYIYEVLTKLYSATPDGYCGDEDNGQTSAWYIFSSLGFYPVTPVSDHYYVGLPLFKEANIYLENGKTLKIKADKKPQNGSRIESIQFNQKAIKDYQFNFFEMQKGGEIHFKIK